MQVDLSRLDRLLSAIDFHIDAAGLGDDLPPAAPRAVIAHPHHEDSLHTQRDHIRTVVWATGHRRSYPWLSVPVLDQCGEIRQHHGRTRIRSAGRRTYRLGLSPHEVALFRVEGEERLREEGAGG